MPEVFSTIEAMRQWAACVRRQGERLALVPTMGALHQGHLALVAEARRRASRVVVSIFVNPLQFAPAEDLSRYPRTLADDLDKLQQFGVEGVFHPAVKEMYPDGPQPTRVIVPAMSAVLCGRTRPTHFEGVATVVTKLLHIVSPDLAVFGEKDWQQLAIIRRMVADLNFPVEILGVPIVRDEGGLALSSRNRYLAADEVEQAHSLYRSLLYARRLYEAGERHKWRLLDAATQILEQAGLSPEYVELVHPESLKSSPDILDGPAVLALAVYVGRARLIDNIKLGNTSALSAYTALDEGDDGG